MSGLQALKIPEPEDDFDEPGLPTPQQALIGLLGSFLLIVLAVTLDSAAAWLLINIVAGLDASFREALAVGLASVFGIAAIAARTQ